MTTTASRRQSIIRRAAAVLAACALAVLGVLAVPASASAANIVVSSTANAGAGTLREAVDNSTAGDTITFDSSFDSAQTIELASPILIQHTVTIDGPGEDLLTISRDSGAGTLNQFEVSPGLGVVAIVVDISSVTIAGGGGTTGAGFYSDAAEVTDITFDHVVFLNENGGAQRGAGANIQNVSNDVSFLNGAFVDNTADTAAGAYLSEIGGDILFQTIDFDNNDTSVGQAGGVEIDSSNAVTFSDAGTGENNDSHGGGAVAYIQTSGAITITEGTYTTNTAGSGGGAFFIQNVDSVDVLSATIQDNTAGQFGGGGLYIDTVSGAVHITDVDLIHNSSLDVNGWAGGLRLSAVAGGATIASSDISRNISAGDGGGFALMSNPGLMTILDSVFSDNEAQGGDGGGIYVLGSEAGFELVRSSVLGNSATNGGAALGGGLYGGTISQTFSIFDSTFAGNSAEDAGQSTFINTMTSFFQVSQGTFDEKGANTEYAIVLNHLVGQSALAELSYSTVVGPGGLSINDNEGDADLWSTVVDGGSNDFGVVSNAPIDATYSMVSDAAAGAITAHAGFLAGVTDFKLGALADNGGPTLTRLPLAGSPVINAGQPGLVPPQAFDQRGTGFARVVSGRVDIGAVEAQPYLAATGGTINPWLPIGGVALLLLGVGALVVVRRARTDSAGHRQAR